MSLPILIQEPAMAEGDGDRGVLPQRDTPTISPNRCNDADIWHYDSNKGLCTNEEVHYMDTIEDTDMIYESLGDCCDVHFNIRVSNDVGLDFDSNGINNGCNSFDVCDVVSCWMWYYLSLHLSCLLSSYLILYITQIERRGYSTPNNHDHTNEDHPTS